MDVVITDLDGTLLDHESYSFAAAQPALDALRAREIPLVLCTSKTRSEVEQWRTRLANGHPFIVENGGAVFLPENYFPFPVPEARRRDGYQVLQLGTAYPDLVQTLRDAAAQTGCLVRGFHQMSTAEVAETCAMTEDAAVLAKQREFDEPFLLLSPDREAELLAAIERMGSHWTRGGRFYHVIGENDKAAAVKSLLRLYRRLAPGIRSMGLGDGMNDAGFLNAVDVPILIRTPWLAKLQQAVPRGHVTLTRGPQGWNDAILGLLALDQR